MEIPGSLESYCSSPKKVLADFTIHPPKIVALLGFAPKLRGDVLKLLRGVFNKKISMACRRKDA